MQRMHVTKGIWRSALALVVVVWTICAVQAEAYRLAPGDTIRVQIIGLGAEPFSANVNAAGNIRLPYLGVYQASGKTLDELASDISISSAGHQIEVRDEGGRSIVVLDEDDIFLDIEQYRPVTVTGAVKAPGRVVFEPGLSVRAVIGIAGGLSLPGQFDTGSQLTNLRIQLDALRQTQAWLVADLWRVNALLSEADPQVPPPDIERLASQELTDANLDVVRERISASFDQLERDREDLQARIALAQSEIEFLKIALQQYETASIAEEERLQNILELSERGLTTANALDSARDAALNTSSRLLTTQADLAEAERNYQSLLRDELELDARFRVELLEEKVRTERSLAETQARISAIRGELALGAVLADEEGTVPGFRVILYRRESEADVGMSAAVQPGDVIEVLLEDF